MQTLIFCRGHNICKMEQVNMYAPLISELGLPVVYVYFNVLSIGVAGPYNFIREQITSPKPRSGA